MTVDLCLFIYTYLSEGLYGCLGLQLWELQGTQFPFKIISLLLYPPLSFSTILLFSLLFCSHSLIVMNRPHGVKYAPSEVWPWISFPIIPNNRLCENFETAGSQDMRLMNRNIWKICASLKNDTMRRSEKVWCLKVSSALILTFKTPQSTSRGAMRSFFTDSIFLR